MVENAMESQKAGREELSRLRRARQLTASASRPGKQQWGAFKEQLRKVRECVMGVIQPYERRKLWHMGQHGGTMKTLC